MDNFFQYSNLPFKKRPKLVKFITYSELVIMAFDVSIDDTCAEQYQKLLLWLRKYIPNKEYREEMLNKAGCRQLQLFDNGMVWYCD